MTDHSAATSNEIAEQRAREMAALPFAQRNMMIALGILTGVVVDARRMFERWSTAPVVETVTVFEGVYGPEDWDCG